jgi:hypothetical protein
MKTLSLLTMLLTSTVYAEDIITCINPSEPDLTYILKAIDYDHYSFTIQKRTLIPQTCRTRWGCDYEEKIIFFDKLIMADYQGASVFESKRAYIEIEDMNEVSYIYTIKRGNGTFEAESITLKCQ